MTSRKHIWARLRAGLFTVAWVWCAASFFHPASVLASEREGRWGIWEGVGRIFNLALVVAVLVYALRKPLGQFLDERRQNIRKSLDDAQQAKIATDAKLAEMEKRMSVLDAEMAEIKEKAAREAEEERRRSLQMVEQETERIVAVARREAEALVRAAEAELRDHTAGLAVELAQAKIRADLGAEEDRRLAEKFVHQLGKSR